MNFSDLFIRRPVLSTVVGCMMLLLGFQGIFNLTIRQYPKVDETAITITTAYPGASADLIQGFISAPIARAVSSTENIDYVTSQSRPSSSTVVVQMKLGSNPDVALTEVLSKVQGVRGTLPTRESPWSGYFQKVLYNHCYRTGSHNIRHCRYGDGRSIWDKRTGPHADL
jgi:multidrug efflux pump